MATTQYLPLITTASTFDAVVLCDGDYPTHAIPLSILHNAPYLCCCDGAGMRHILHGGTPDAIVGDGDSLPDDFKRRYADILHLVSRQDDNDQTKATLHCMEQGFQRIAYIGSTGKREDHTIGNIALLLHYMQHLHLDVTMITDHGYFTPAQGDTVIQTFPRQQISIFNISCTQLAGEGLKWAPTAFDQLWQGTLNEALSEQVVLHGDGSYLLYRTFDAK